MVVEDTGLCRGDVGCFYVTSPVKCSSPAPVSRAVYSLLMVYSREMIQHFHSQEMFFVLWKSPVEAGGGWEDVSGLQP